MKKFFTFFLTILFGVSAFAYTVPEDGTYSLLNNKVNAGGGFVVLGDGVFAFRLGGGYSYDNAKGLKTQSNQGGMVFYLDGQTNLTVTINHQEAKNAHDVTVNVYAISEDQYKEFDEHQASDKKQTLSLAGITPETYTIAIPAEIGDFPGTTSLSAGYYAVVPVGAKGNTYCTSIGFQGTAPITDPVTKVTVSGPEKGVKGFAAAFAATTDVKATAYQWFVNDVAQNEAVGKSFEFTPAAGGNYNIVCKARNDNNAQDEWAASDALVFAVANTLSGEIIKATLKGGPDAEVTGIVGGTFDSNLKSGKYKIDKGYYAGIILAEGTFQAGDTVIITMSAAGGNYPCLFGDKDRNNLLFLATEGSEALEYRIVLTESANGVNSLYISRDADEADGYKWNPTLTSIAVVRPMPETSRVEELTGAKIADYTLTESNLSALKYNKYIKIGEDYVAAPVVVFTKTITITYEDSSTKEVTEDIKVTATADGNLWKAYATIAGEEYTIAANKAASYTVTYMFGKNVLGTEMVAVGAEPKEYEQYQTMTLATFEGWYRDEDLTTPVSLPMAITQDFTFYAKFTMAYLNKNVNIEQLVLDYGTKYDIASALTAAGWAYENLNDLDTLNDLEKKDNRNYAFLGLKMKTKGAYIQGNLKVDGVLIVKFGNLGCNVTVTAKGANTDMEVTITKEMLAEMNNEFPIGGFTEDVLITLTTTDGSTVVLKQLMLDELAEVTLPAPGAYLVTCEANENGKVEVAWPNKKYRTPVGETVTITATPNDGYALASITVNGTAIEAVEGAYSFEMPAEEVTVAAVFTSTVALENIKAEDKAVKVVINGQLYIKKGDKLFNALGTMLK